MKIEYCDLEDIIGFSEQVHIGMEYEVTQVKIDNQVFTLEEVVTLTPGQYVMQVVGTSIKFIREGSN